VKRITMVTITEAALRGQWFYLEEDQPIETRGRTFFEMVNGKIRSNARVDPVGTYLIAGAKALLTFTRHGHPDFVMTLQVTGDIFDEATPSLQADGRYRMEAFGQPVSYSGTFVRRVADRSSSWPAWRRLT
jgi:hypothetical protein